MPWAAISQPPAFLVLAGLAVGCIVTGEKLHGEGIHRETLLQRYRDFLTTTASPICDRITLLTANSHGVVHQYLLPWELLHGFFTGKVVFLRWVVTRALLESLGQELDGIPNLPTPLDTPPPARFAVPQRNRADQDFRASQVSSSGVADAQVSLFQ
jgi:hypothetical protein